MKEQPLYECKGEKFQKIQIFNDKVVLINKDKKVELDLNEVCCLTNKMCQDRECRLWIPCPSLNNCVLNIDHEYQCHEIGDMTGVSRQAVSDAEMRARKRFLKRVWRMKLPLKLEGWLYKEHNLIRRNKQAEK